MATDALGQEYLVRILADLKCSSSSPCTGGKTFEFTLDGYVNPFSTKSINGLVISTSTTKQSSLTDTNYEIINVRDQEIGTDITFSAYTPGDITINSLIRTVTSVDAPTNVQFDIKITNRLEKGGYIKIKIPTTQLRLSGGLVQF